MLNQRLLNFVGTREIAIDELDVSPFLALESDAAELGTFHHKLRITHVLLAERWIAQIVEGLAEILDVLLAAHFTSVQNSARHRGAKFEESPAGHGLVFPAAEVLPAMAILGSM
ncbi:hypothetical protein D3C85_1367750 [compost metagenome]